MLNLLLWPASIVLFWRRDRIRCGIALRKAQRMAPKNHKAAEELFERALSFGITDSRPYVQYAAALLECGEAGRAVELLHSAVEVDPESPVPLIFLGLAFSDFGRRDDARSALQQAREKAPGNLLAKSALSLVEARSGDAAAAAKDLLDNAIADNLNLRARLLVAVERHLRGERAAGMLSELLPPPASESEDKQVGARSSGRQCFKNAARALAKGEYRYARASLEAAIERKHDTDETRLYLGGTYLGLGEYREAARRFAAMPESSPMRGSALFYAGVSRYLAGEPRAALELFDQAAEAGNIYDVEELISYYRGVSMLAAGQDETAVRREFLSALDIDWTLLPRRLADVANDQDPK
jgi:tetratricopeptide (TPR) repeat protein